jgi:hypothetical protein
MNTDPNYEPKTLLAAFDQGPIVHTFLRDTFFGAREFPPTATIEFDFRRGRRKMAPFVAPLVGGKLMERSGFETRFFKAPRIAPVRALRVPDLEPRMFGETIYEGSTPADRAAQLLAEDSIFLDDAITRREEWMCRQVLVNGKIVVTAETGYQMSIDYLAYGYGASAGTANNHETVTVKWDTQTGSDPLADLERARLNTIKFSGISPNVALFGNAAKAAFIANQQVKTYLDNRRYELGNITPVIQDDAVVRFATVPGLECYSYAEYFEDDAGTLFAMMPDPIVVLASTNVQNKIVYGAFTQLEDVKAKRYVTYQTSRIPFVYGDEEDGNLFYRLTACPLPMPTDILGFRIVEALTGGAGPFADEPYLADESLETHSVEELRDIATNEGVDVPTHASKGEIVKAIKKQRKGKGEAEAEAEDEGNLEDHTVEQLREIAESEGADLTGLTVKADIIKAIKKNRNKK